MFYETALDNPFASQKTSLTKEKYKVGNVTIDSVFYSISYDGQDRLDDFDFSQRDYTGASYYVLSPKGETFEVQITDDEAEEDDDSEDEFTDDSQAGLLEFHCENSSTAKKLIAELSTWGSFYHEIKIQIFPLPNSKVTLKITGTKAILTRVDTVTNQPGIQALGAYTKKFSD